MDHQLTLSQESYQQETEPGLKPRPPIGDAATPSTIICCAKHPFLNNNPREAEERLILLFQGMGNLGPRIGQVPKVRDRRSEHKPCSASSSSYPINCSFSLT